MKSPNNKLFDFKSLLIIVVITLTSVCCISNTSPSEKKKEITVYLNCSSNETAIDLEYSINQIKDKLSKNHISIKIDSIQKKCGYMLVYGKKKKTINSAMTDLELIDEVNTFFK